MFVFLGTSCSSNAFDNRLKTCHLSADSCKFYVERIIKFVNVTVFKCR